MAFIRLMGSRDEVINGNGATLHTMGSGNTTVQGNVQSVTNMSSGSLTIHGSVTQNFQIMGSGNAKIDGSVNGKVSHLGSGNLLICGDVYGDIIQIGTGVLTIEGIFYGKTKTQMGTGRIVLTAKKPPGYISRPSTTKLQEKSSISIDEMQGQSNSNVDVKAKPQVNNEGDLDSSSSAFILPLFKKCGNEEQNLITIPRIVSMLSSLLLLWGVLQSL